MANFGPKSWTNPFGKFGFSQTFIKLDFSCLDSIFYPEYKKKRFFLARFAQKQPMRKMAIFDEKHKT